MPAVYETLRKVLGEADEHEGAPALQSNGVGGIDQPLQCPVSPLSQGLGDTSWDSPTRTPYLLLWAQGDVTGPGGRRGLPGKIPEAGQSGCSVLAGIQVSQLGAEGVSGRSPRAPPGPKPGSLLQGLVYSSDELRPCPENNGEATGHICDLVVPGR